MFTAPSSQPATYKFRAPPRRDARACRPSGPRCRSASLRFRNKKKLTNRTHPADYTIYKPQRHYWALNQVSTPVLLYQGA